MNPLYKLVRNKHAADCLGVMRGLSRVGGKIVQRLNYLPEDGIYLTKNIEKQFAAAKNKLNEAQDFLSTAEQMMNAGQGEEFVTFEKPVFEYKKKEREATEDIMNRHFSDKQPDETAILTPEQQKKTEEVRKVVTQTIDDIFFVPQANTKETTRTSEAVKSNFASKDSKIDGLSSDSNLNKAQKAQNQESTDTGALLTEKRTKDNLNTVFINQAEISKQSQPSEIKQPEPVMAQKTETPKTNTIKRDYNFEDYHKKKESDFSQVVEKKVPSNSFSRAFEFTKVGSSIMGSAVGSLFKNSIVGSESKSLRDFALTEENAEKLAMALCKMRGAALKLGQALSMQEDQFMPESIKKAFKKARQSANIMPTWQLEKILLDAFGQNWLSDHFQTFNMRPFAAASIGQVHRATLKDGTKVVLKIQYPGVASSIDSDLDNLKRLMNYTGIFPKTMFLDDFINNTRIELKEECDYIIEAEKQRK